MVKWLSRMDICGGQDSGGCDHYRGTHPNGGPCNYKESTGPNPEDEIGCEANCQAFVEPPDIELESDSVPE